MQQRDFKSSPHLGQSKASVIVFFAIAAMVLTADLVSKEMSFARVAGQPVVLTPENVHQRDVIPPHPPIRVIPYVLSLRLTLNHGAVFGLGQGGRWAFIPITLVAVIVILTIFWRSERWQRVLHVGLALVLAGAIGNLYDRIVHHAVRDMLYLFPGVHLPFGWQWPGGNRELYPWIFNIADVALCVGVALILVSMFRKPPIQPEAGQRSA